MLLYIPTHALSLLIRIQYKTILPRPLLHLEADRWQRADYVTLFSNTSRIPSPLRVTDDSGVFVLEGSGRRTGGKRGIKTIYKIRWRL